jgi:hypothetical protein
MSEFLGGSKPKVMPVTRNIKLSKYSPPAEAEFSEPKFEEEGFLISAI